MRPLSSLSFSYLSFSYLLSVFLILTLSTAKVEAIVEVEFSDRITDSVFSPSSPLYFDLNGGATAPHENMCNAPSGLYKSEVSNCSLDCGTAFCSVRCTRSDNRFEVEVESCSRNSLVFWTGHGLTIDWRHNSSTNRFRTWLETFLSNADFFIRPDVKVVVKEYKTRTFALVRDGERNLFSGYVLSGQLIVLDTSNPGRPVETPHREDFEVGWAPNRPLTEEILFFRLTDHKPLYQLRGLSYAH